MISYLGKQYLWRKRPSISLPRPWIGISHRPFGIPEWFPAEMAGRFYYHLHFPAVLPTCCGIFALSKYHARQLARDLPVVVDNLIHPTEIPQKQWNPAALTDATLKVVQVGWWLRKLHAIFMLPKGNYDKIYLAQRSSSPVDRLLPL